MAAKYETKQRTTLLAFFAAHPDEAIPVSTITDTLSSSGISQASVYRNLALLESEGMIQRVAKEGTREAYFRYLKAEGCKQHLHLSCTKCGKTFHLDLPSTENLIASVQNDANFEVDSSSTILYGICSSCKKRVYLPKSEN